MRGASDRGENVQDPGTTAPHRPPACARCGAAHGARDPCPESRTLPLGSQAAAAPPAAPDPLVGSQVGSFRIVRLLGRGGMGTVYLAEHPVIGSRVAVKFLHESMCSDPAVVARFYDEARAVNLIGHENIVGIYDLSVLPPARYYFVMEHLDGETLQAVRRAGTLSREGAKEVLLQICDALQCAHDHGVVHRDVKPDNVFLVKRRGRARFVKLVDFGIAKLRDAAHGGSTAAGFIVGTPEYMSPEQCENGAIDARTDVYAVGVMAFELVTGRLPFQGRNVPQLLLAHLREAPPRPGALAAVHPELERAILRALEKDPAARFPSMQELAAALEAAPFAAGDLPPATSGASAAVRPTPAALAALSVEVRAPGRPPAALPAVELTRAGLFLRADPPHPALRSRVAVSLSHPTLKAALALEAEVIRHVDAAEGAGWNMTPGFAVQFASPPPEVRAALVALADEARRDTPPPTVRIADADERLRALEARRQGGPYALLGLAPDAEFAAVRRAIRTAREDLDAIAARPAAADHPARAAALRMLVASAQEAIGTPAARLLHDARQGNHAGVERCLQAGVPQPLVEARRAQLLREDPGRAAEAQRQLARAEVARKLGNAAAAAAACEAALAADPLDPAARAAYAALRGGAPLRPPS
jgi:tRNA A-37 threonylcarbamoyl transferase component Bud32